MLKSMDSLTRMLESVYAWPADRAFLAAELGGAGSGPSYLSSAVMRERGRLALESGAVRTALDQLGMAIALNPMSAFAFELRGETYLQMSQYERALADFDTAIALNPKLARVFANRGVTYLRMSQYERALADFDAAIALNPNFAQVFANRGVTYLNMGDIRSRAGRLRPGHRP